MRIQRKKAKPKSKKLFIIIPFLILLFSAGLFGIYFPINHTRDKRLRHLTKSIILPIRNILAFAQNLSPEIINGKKFQLNIRSRKMKRLIA